MGVPYLYTTPPPWSGSCSIPQGLLCGNASLRHSQWSQSRGILQGKFASSDKCPRISGIWNGAIPVSTSAPTRAHLAQPKPERQRPVKSDDSVLLQTPNYLPYSILADRSDLIDHDLTSFFQAVLGRRRHVKPEQRGILQMTRYGTTHKTTVRRVRQIGLNHDGRPWLSIVTGEDGNYYIPSFYHDQSTV